MNEILPDPKDNEAEDKKPSPKVYDGISEGKDAPMDNATELGERNPSDIKYNDSGTKEIQPKADVPIENATSDDAEETEAKDMQGQHCPSCTCGDHEESMEDILDQHIDNAKEMADKMDDGQPANTGELLDQHIENAKDMVDSVDNDGVSRPGDFDQKDQDMGLSEEDEESNDPNLDDVLRDGLDQHAQEIQKEKVVQLVGQALDGFKSQKKILDKAKDQAPELHDACINMLRAMIELCSLAGIDQSGEAEQEVNEIEGQSESPEEQSGAEEMPEESATESEESEDACPNCGHEKKAAPKEDAAQAPKE